ncbi:hypothetical protein DASC09_010490 [Saccharomycopsis crataegensis]|uniref:Uncharacterized protein n=1 Tax=Saccharomycopsis crataegensis TaxID=43959 RepID=A0AAV5QGD5_9ASCO|nr:hypothetical protein DASC09_010490 [Saccharomycopsis crataegensis]
MMMKVKDISWEGEIKFNSPSYNNKKSWASISRLDKSFSTTELKNKISFILPIFKRCANIGHSLPPDIITFQGAIESFILLCEAAFFSWKDPTGNYDGLNNKIQNFVARMKVLDEAQGLSKSPWSLPAHYLDDHLWEMFKIHGPLSQFCTNGLEMDNAISKKLDKKSRYGVKSIANDFGMLTLKRNEESMYHSLEWSEESFENEWKDFSLLESLPQELPKNGKIYHTMNHFHHKVTSSSVSSIVDFPLISYQNELLMFVAGFRDSQSGETSEYIVVIKAKHSDSQSKGNQTFATISLKEEDYEIKNDMEFFECPSMDMISLRQYFSCSGEDIGYSSLFH